MKEIEVSLKSSTASIIVFLIVTVIYFVTKEEKYQLYSYIMLASFYITRAIESLKEQKY